MQGSKRDTDVKTDFWTLWEKVNSIEMCITICKIDDHCKFDS